MARRQRHLVDIGRVPGRDDEAARIRVVADLFDHVGELIDRAPVRRRPGAPLAAVDRAEIAVLVRPLVPDAHAVVLQIAHVGVAGDEPEQFVDDRFEMQLLGRDHRKAVRQIEAHLMAEHRQRAGAGAVALLGAVGEDAFHQLVVLAHGAAFDRVGARSLADRAARRNERRPCPQVIAAAVRPQPVILMERSQSASRRTTARALRWNSGPFALRDACRRQAPQGDGAKAALGSTTSPPPRPP